MQVKRLPPYPSTPAPRSQGGWIGLVGLLIALVIVAVLAQTVLKSYGLIGGGDSTAARGSRVQPASTDAPQAPRAASPMERARSLERDVERDAQDLSRRIDEQTK